MVMLFSVLVMGSEFLHISNKGNYPATTRITLAASAAVYALFYFYGSGLMAPRYFWLLSPLMAAIPISLLYSKNKVAKTRGEGYEKSGFFMMAPVYTALPFALTNLILFDNHQNYNPTILLSLFILLWSCDVGAYLFGMTFGQKNGHKLFPSVSPKKSWEGFFGGMFSSLVAAFFIYYFDLLDFGFFHIALISIIVFLFSVFGDLVESLFKRNFGVKDSGNLMPGHGGLLDRFDGALVAFPVAIAYIKIFELF
jgi:phosphatidate cytidylyltransferase